MNKEEEVYSYLILPHPLMRKGYIQSIKGSEQKREH